MADPGVITDIKRAAQQTGADPAALLATSLTEDGARFGVIGDNGTSEGAFQFHQGGALPAGKPLTWGDSYAAFLNRAQQFAKNQVHGGQGAAAIQRPANPGAYAQKVDENLEKARQILAEHADAAAAMPQPTATTVSKNGVIPGGQLLQSIISANAKNAGIASITIPVTAPRATSLPVHVAPEAQGTGNVDKTGATIVETARKYLGVPYKWGGTNPKTGLDCSGLLQLVAGQAGIKIPRTSQQQFNVGKPVAKGALQPGDAVFFEPTSAGPGHVGIYIGAGKYLDAPHTGTVVQIQSLAANPTYVGARRFT